MDHMTDEEIAELVGGGLPSDETTRLTANELRAFVERIERIELDVIAAREDQKEVFAEAKARGYDIPTIRKILKLRKRAADDIAESEAIEDMYREVLGLPPMGGVHG